MRLFRPNIRKLEEKKDVEGLCRALADKEPDVRQAAVQALGRIGDATTAARLFEMLKDEALSAAATEALAQIGAPAVDLLCANVKEYRTKDTSKAAAKALGAIGGAQAIEALITTVKDDWVGGVRPVAAEALTKIGAPAVEPLCASLMASLKGGAAIAEVLGRIGDTRAVEPLSSTLLRAETVAVCQASALALGRIGGARAIELLGTALRSLKQGVREAAAKAFVETSLATDPETQTWLAAVNPEAKWQERGEAVINLVGLGRSVGDPRLQAAISAIREWSEHAYESSTSYEVYDEDQFGRLHREVISTYDPVAAQRAQANELLKRIVGKVEERQDIQGLIQATATESMCQPSIEALARIGAPAVQPLCDALRAKEPNVRYAVASALGRIGDARAIQPLVAAFKSEGGKWVFAEALVEIGAPAVEPLCATLQSKHPEVRRVAVKTLGKLRQSSPSVFAALVPALKDQSIEVRKEAAQALGNLKPTSPNVVGALLAALQDEAADVREKVVVALENLEPGPDAVPALLTALQSSDGRVREYVARAMGRLKEASPEVVSALRAVLEQEIAHGSSSGYWNVTKHAIEALIQLAQKSSDAAAALTVGLQIKNSHLRDLVANALARLQAQMPEVVAGVLPQVVASVLVALQYKDDWPARKTAVQVLGDLRLASDDVFKALVIALQDHIWSVREEAAEALGKIGDARAIEPLRAAHENEQDLKVVKAIQTALDRIAEMRDSPKQTDKS